MQPVGPRRLVASAGSSGGSRTSVMVISSRSTSTEAAPAEVHSAGRRPVTQALMVLAFVMV